MFIMIIASCELPFRVTVMNEPYMYNNKIMIDQNHRKNMIVKIMLLLKRTETNSKKITDMYQLNVQTGLFGVNVLLFNSIPSVLGSLPPYKA